MINHKEEAEQAAARTIVSVLHVYARARLEPELIKTLAREVVAAACPHVTAGAAGATERVEHEIDGGVHVHPTVYQLSVFPDEIRDSSDDLAVEEAAAWSVTVEWRGRGLWAVKQGLLFWNAVTGRFGHDDPGGKCRFTRNEAMDIAAQRAPKVTINGYTALDVLAKHRPAGHAKGASDDQP